MFCKRNPLAFVSIIFLWRMCNIKAYVDVCEYNSPYVKCNCETMSYHGTESDYKATCIISKNVPKTHSIWKTLSDSKNVSYLELEGLEYIPPDLKRMSSLRELKITDGKLTTLKSYELSSFMSLEELDLKNNQIEILESHAISNIPKLKTLYLSYNLLHEIQSGALGELLQLENLYLDVNKLSRIEACAFCKQQNMTFLFLSDNELSDLTEYTFQGLCNLKSLMLDTNKIRCLKDNIFHFMERLTYLDLVHNEIYYISAGAFNGLGRLETLLLNYNRIKSLPGYIFAPLVSLIDLSLHVNEIEIIEEDMIYCLQNIKSESFYLRIDGNPFRCDCAMQWISAFRNRSDNRNGFQSIEDAECKLGNEITMNMLKYLEKSDCIVSDKKSGMACSLATDLNAKHTCASAGDTMNYLPLFAILMALIIVYS